HVLRERGGISGVIAFRLGRYYDTTAQLWMNLQSEYSLATAYAANGEQIEHEIEPLLAQG
ncbi:transcriptional regulator, partial [Pseudomonas aeruginosa]|uniref:helix-turn-helix transcriptional regulator n=1 Tax=Pseudomonas aeruginosa TaxID=287 RepID=UPI0039688847